MMLIIVVLLLLTHFTTVASLVVPNPAYVIRISDDLSALSALVLKKSLLASFSLQSILPLELRPTLPGIDFVAVRPSSATNQAKWTDLLLANNFTVIADLSQLDPKVRTLELWPHGLSLKSVPLFSLGEVWNYQSNGMTNTSAPKNVDTLLSDTFIARCPLCPEPGRAPEASRLPATMMVRSCAPLLNKPSHVEFHTWPGAIKDPECLKRYENLIKLYLAVAYAPSVARTRMLIAHYNRDTFAPNMQMTTLASAALRFSHGLVNRAYYEALFGLTKHLISEYPPFWFANYGVQAPRLLKPKQARADPTEAADAAKLEAESWLKKDGAATCAGLANDDQAKPLKFIERAKKQTSRPKVLWAMLTHKTAHEDRALPMMQTWLSRVDNLVVLSDEHDERIASQPFNHDGPQSYENLWNIAMGAYTHLFANYFDNGTEEFEWLAFVSDDVFCIPENVELLLSELHVVVQSRKQPMYLGRQFNAKLADPSGDIASYLSGGSLRLFNAKALKILVEQINTSEFCSDDALVAEDVHTSRCLALGGVQPYHSHDVNGKERFHPFPPDMMFYPGKFKDHPIWVHHIGWYPHYQFPPLNPADISMDMAPVKTRIGFQFVSPKSVSFHLYLKKNSPDSHAVSLYYRLYLLMYPSLCVQARAAANKPEL